MIRERNHNGVTIVMPVGRLDSSSASQFMSGSPSFSGNGKIVIDLSEVDFIDSTGLGSLVGIARKKREQGGDVRLACLNEKLRKVFEITQAFRLFDIYDDAETAAGRQG